MQRPAPVRIGACAAEAPASVTVTSSPAAAWPYTFDGPVALEHGVVHEQARHERLLRAMCRVRRDKTAASTAHTNPPRHSL